MYFRYGIIYAKCSSMQYLNIKNVSLFVVLAVIATVMIGCNRYKSVYNDSSEQMEIPTFRGKVKEVELKAWFVDEYNSEYLQSDKPGRFNRHKEEQYNLAYDNSGYLTFCSYKGLLRRSTSEEYIYNTAHDVLKKIKTTGEGEFYRAGSDSLVRIYDTDSVLLKTITYTDSMLREQEVYRYDEEGKKISMSTYDKDNILSRIVRYKYDEYGYVKEERYFDGSMHLFKKISREFCNTHGLVCKSKEERWLNGFKSESKEVFGYDGRGRKIYSRKEREAIHYGKYIPYVADCSYEYDDRDNILKIEWRNESGMVSDKHTMRFKYFYDSEGNWREKWQYFLKDGRKVIARRYTADILYY
jgi:hypothetical protein